MFIILCVSKQYVYRFFDKTSSIYMG